jgi:hypothetical protein
MMIMMIMMIMRSGEGRVELAVVGAEDRVQQLVPLSSRVQVAGLTAFRRAEEVREAAVLASTTIKVEEKGEEVMEARASAFWKAAFLANRI